MSELRQQQQGIAEDMAEDTTARPIEVLNTMVAVITINARLLFIIAATTTAGAIRPTTAVTITAVTITAAIIAAE